MAAPAPPPAAFRLGACDKDGGDYNDRQSDGDQKKARGIIALEIGGDDDGNDRDRAGDDDQPTLPTVGCCAIAECLLPEPVFGHAAVPPTVKPSSLSVGWPTPTGTLWPFLPQVPMPLSSFMSLPIMLTRVSDSGPEPIKVAPLMGAPSLPFSTA